MDGCGERMVMGWYGDEWWCLVQKKQHQLTKVKKRGSIGGRFASPNTSIEFQVSSARQDLEWFRRLQNIRWIWYDLIWSDDLILWFDVIQRLLSRPTDALSAVAHTVTFQVWQLSSPPWPNRRSRNSSSPTWPQEVRCRDSAEMRSDPRPT
jgi:hypothetical protein